MQNRLTNSQRYLVNAKPGTNHSTNPTNPTNPTTKYRCESYSAYMPYYSCLKMNDIYTGA